MKLHGGSAVINISIKTVVDIKMGLSLDVETRFHAPYNEENEKLCGFMCVCVGVHVLKLIIENLSITLR